MPGPGHRGERHRLRRDGGGSREILHVKLFAQRLLASGPIVALERPDGGGEEAFLGGTNNAGKNKGARQAKATLTSILHMKTEAQRVEGLAQGHTASEGQSRDRQTVLLVPPGLLSPPSESLLGAWGGVQRHLGAEFPRLSGLTPSGPARGTLG